ncbi:hypothetical protein ACS0TY_022548 [Phlomoides rotata]
MAAYAAVTTLHHLFSQIIKRVDVLLPPPSLKILEFAEKELKSFRNFVERLDSKSRERMSASLKGIFYTIVVFIGEYSLIYDDLNNILDEERLDALNIRFYNFPLEVLKMVKLRYLALTCNGNLPSSISNLRKLQYLIVHPHLSIKPCGALFNLPMEIWNMKRLKHLQVTGYDLPNLGDTSLQELTTLSDVTTRSCMVLNSVPNLKKLGIKIELAPNAVDPMCCFDHISHLTKLESLKCVIVNPEFKHGVVSPVSSFPCFSFSLEKLSLSGMGYPWEEMSKIASLPNLKVLKLRFNAFRGPEWELEENGFPNLLVLLIEDIDLVKLKWAHGSFKSLKVLRIKHCYKLKELHFRSLPKIVEIEVVDCSPPTEWHVKNNALKYFAVDHLLVRSSWKL